MWHKAIWKGHPMRLELTRVGLLVELAMIPKQIIAQSAGAVEYTDCFSAEG